MKKRLGFHISEAQAGKIAENTTENTDIFSPFDDQKFFFTKTAFQSPLIKIKTILLDLESFYSPFSRVFDDQAAQETRASPGFSLCLYVMCEGRVSPSQVRGFNGAPCDVWVKLH